ncbi:cupin domain-containing protein [Ramlibacter sp.]|uniref:cupin domain-containing protein n=1 Tax=Ramlibacter sp. TaxID=1917967 RepID=UPI003D14B575
MRALKIDYEAVPWKDAGPGGVQYKPVLLNGLGASLVKFGPNATHKVHSHDEVQMVFCLEGEIDFFVKDSQSERLEVLKKGDVIAFQPGVEHGTRTVGPAMCLVIWNPMERFTADSIVV